MNIKHKRFGGLAGLCLVILALVFVFVYANADHGVPAPAKAPVVGNACTNLPGGSFNYNDKGPGFVEQTSSGLTCQGPPAVPTPSPAVASASIIGATCTNLPDGSFNYKDGGLGSVEPAGFGLTCQGPPAVPGDQTPPTSNNLHAAPAVIPDPTHPYCGGANSTPQAQC